MTLLHCKQIVPIDSLGTASDRNSPFPTKKQMHYNMSLFLGNEEWPIFDQLWEVIGSCISESYLKS